MTQVGTESGLLPAPVSRSAIKRGPAYRLGTTERWVFRNPSAQSHVVHTHLDDQKLVSRNGQPPSPQERLKESWLLAPGDEVVVDVRFTDHVGKFVLHCHVLEHEDDGMMTQFQTLPSA